MLDPEQVKARKRELLRLYPDVFAGVEETTMFRCDECEENGTCRSAFDPYNIGDDYCIEEK